MTILLVPCPRKRESGNALLLQDPDTSDRRIQAVRMRIGDDTEVLRRRRCYFLYLRPGLSSSNMLYTVSVMPNDA